jgi:hypothetical protein
MPRIVRNEEGVVFDQFGMMKGGVRTPIIDVPIASYYAGVTMPPTSDPCGVAGGAVALSGTTRVFTGDQLAELYPTPQDYLKKFDAATDDAVRNGYILPSDAEQLRKRAKDAADFIATATGN